MLLRGKTAVISGAAGRRGIGLATAILLDALLVRTILVPAVMHLGGKANWWFPGWLDRILPRVSVEGPSDDGDPATAPSPRTAAPV